LDWRIVTAQHPPLKKTDLDPVKNRQLFELIKISTKAFLLLVVWAKKRRNVSILYRLETFFICFFTAKKKLRGLQNPQNCF
jgi:hypothetical protein